MSIAAGVPMYSREKALAQFLSSVPEDVDTVYVADNGPDQDRDLYDQKWRGWPFDLEVLHLEHDVGIGACRHAIVEAARETHDYLWMGDCDMRFLDDGDVETLVELLEALPDLGGVSGWLIEDNTVRSGARDIIIANGTAIKDGSRPEVEEAAGIPYARFDFIPQAGVFRTDALDDYSWDADVPSTEHMDFFLGHRQTEWDFASTPAVLIAHDRGIDPEYREARGRDHVDETVLEQKWGISEVVPGRYREWDDRTHRAMHEQVFDVFRYFTPPSVWLPARRALKGVLK